MKALSIPAAAIVIVILTSCAAVSHAGGISCHAAVPVQGAGRPVVAYPHGAVRQPFAPHHGFRRYGFRSTFTYVDPDSVFYSATPMDSWGIAQPAPAQDYNLAWSQAMLNLAEAERIRIDNIRKLAEAAAATKDANKACRAAEVEIRRQKNAQAARDQARLSGKDGSVVGMPVAIVWPAALLDAKFTGYRRLVERAAALQAGGAELTRQERSHLAESHRSVLNSLKNNTTDDGDAAREFVKNFRSHGLPRAVVVAVK